MKKVNVKNIIFIVLFVLILLVPSVSMPFFANAQNTEKRELAEFPGLFSDGGINAAFSSEFNDWVNDRIGFRSNLIYANTVIDRKIFGQSNVEKVVLGKDGWLFFSDTLDDYYGIETLSDDELMQIAENIKGIQDYFEENGISFVFTIVPNKNTLYPEYMKDYYVQGDTEGNFEKIVTKLKEENINYADIYNEFNAKTEIYYQRYDSHWNYEGAYIGYKTIMDKTWKDYNRFDQIGFNEREDWSGDLAEMFYGNAAPKDIQKYPDIEFEYEIVSREKEVDALRLKTYCENGNGNAVIYRDSFFNTAYVYFAENFENVTFSRAFPYNFSLADEETDVVIIEIVERNIKNLVEINNPDD